MPDANGRISRRCNPLARTRGERNDAITTYVPFRNRTALRFFRIVKERTADSRGVTTARAFAPRTRDSSKGAGGADRIRTDDPLLAKQMLSQLSYSPAARILRPRVLCPSAVQCRRSFESWWVWLELNHRPPPYQDGALTN